MLRVSPVSEYDVAVLPVFATSVVQVVPPSLDLSILYPVIAEPPLSEGAVQLKLICEEDTDVAVSPVASLQALSEAMERQRGSFLTLCSRGDSCRWS